MNELMNIFGQVSTAQSFDQIQISDREPRTHPFVVLR